MAALAQRTDHAWPQGLQRVRERAEPWRLVEEGQPAADIVLLGEGQDELVRTAADWINGFLRRTTGAALPVGGEELLTPGKRHLVAVIGQHKALTAWTQAGRSEFPDQVGDQGFVLQRLADPQAGELLICWSPTALGCRYGLIELLREIELTGRSASVSAVRIVERPQFPVRICYVNFAEHMQNAFNPNVLFDVPASRWTLADWERFIDMVSAFRYNVFEFWLVPSLFSPEALQGGKMPRQFAETMSHVIAYAKRRGVAVHPIQAVNTVGFDWHYHCPKVPQEHDELVALWDHWSRALRDCPSMGFFPGDPGGCTKNGCTAETFIDLCLELSQVIRKNSPQMRVEVGTWGEPFGGWGVPLWSGKPDRAERAMKYLLAKLPEFPPGTFTSINLGFSPDCHPTHGGDGRPFARQVAELVPVLTWDYSVTEGEGTVSPRCRARRIFARRNEELAVGCYSGGICYTMAPKLQALNIFCCGEAWWNPARGPDAALADFGRLVFGQELAAIGPLLEEFEVVPDWGYYPPFPYSPQRLEQAMARLVPLLQKVDATAESRLPLAMPSAEYRRTLEDFARLFQKLARVAIGLEKLAAAAKASDRLPPRHEGLVSLTQAEEILAAAGDFPQKAAMTASIEELRKLDVHGLMKHYWEMVYSVYDSIPHPVDPRAQGATSALFNRFNCRLAVVQPPTPIQAPLKATGKPFVLLRLGQSPVAPGWKLSGWTVHGEEKGETWSASFEAPGILARDDFADQGYRWLVVRLCEGPQGGGKTIAINGQHIARFVRTGPPVSEKREWWVTRSYPIPAGLLNSGPMEIRFTELGVAISAVALSAERIADGDN
jgi:hypothetical protein